MGTAIAEAGALMFKDSAVQMDTVFGDGSGGGGGGFFGKLLGAGKRLVTGESLFTTVYTNNASSKQRVAFGAPYPGKILPMDLAALGGTLICQKDAFLCAARGVSLGIYFQQKLSVGFFGGEGFIMQKLDGDGLAFVHAGGTVLRRELQAGQTLLVDTGCLVAMTPNVSFEIQYVGKIKTALFGGEGLFFAKVTGPGTVWLQSLPFSRLASRVFAAAPQMGGRREESALGGLAVGGGLLGGILGGGKAGGQEQAGGESEQIHGGACYETASEGQTLERVIWPPEQILSAGLHGDGIPGKTSRLLTSHGLAF